MGSKYRLGHQTRHRYWPYAAISFAVVMIVVAGIIGPRRIFQSHTVLIQSPPVTKQVSVDTPAPQHINKNVFALDLPVDWRAAPNPNSPYTVYSWQGGGETKDSARRIDVYVDNIPAKLAVNRLLPVESDGDHFNITGNVSDNCANFTDKSAPSGTVPAKWSGVNFLCDTANYERDVVAVGSSEGINMLTLTGPTTGKHHILLTYTDNSANADYSIFIATIQSLHIL